MSRKIQWAIIIVGLAIAFGAYIARAQEPNIEFPVAELGGCASTGECRAYCEEPENHDACLDFAEANNLMPRDEIQKMRSLRQFIRAEGGPGGCDSRQSCKTYCEDVSNIDECVDFAEKAGHEDDFVKDGRKVRAFLKDGGRLPGGCDSKESCEAYCSDFSNLRECRTFHRQAGFDDERGDGPTEEQLDILIKLAEEGKTPGGCSSRDECEAYCSDSKEENLRECFEFGRRLGFIDDREAAVFERTGGKGPGGCVGHIECDAYCRDDANEVECFKFAKDNGFLEDADLEGFRQHRADIRRSFDGLPEGVEACLKNGLGAETVAKAREGFSDEELLGVGRRFDDVMYKCFTEHDDALFGREIERRLNDFPPEVARCIKSETGGLGDVKVGDEQLFEDIVGLCIERTNKEFEKRQREFEEEFKPEFRGELPDEFDRFKEEFKDRLPEADFKRIQDGELKRIEEAEVKRIQDRFIEEDKESFKRLEEGIKTEQKHFDGRHHHDSDFDKDFDKERPTPTSINTPGHLLGAFVNMFFGQ